MLSHVFMWFKINKEPGALLFFGLLHDVTLNSWFDRGEASDASSIILTTNVVEKH